MRNRHDHGFGRFHGEFGDQPDRRFHSDHSRHDDAGEGRSTQLEIDLSTYWYHYAGRATDAKVEVLVIEGAGLKVGDDDRGGTAITFMPVRARLDRDGWYAAAHGGWAFTGGKIVYYR